MNEDTVTAITVDGIRKWTKERLKSLKGLEKQLAKAEDAEAVLKQLDATAWKEFRKKTKALKAASRTAASFKSRVVKEVGRDYKRFTKVLEQLTDKK